MKAQTLMTLVVIALLNVSCSGGGPPVENSMDTVEKLSDKQMAELKLHALPVSDLGFEVENVGNYFIWVGIGKEDVEKYWGDQPFEIKGTITVSKFNKLEKKIVAIFDIEKDVNRVQLDLFREKDDMNEASSDIKIITNSSRVTKGFIFNVKESGDYLAEVQFLVPQQVPINIKTFVMAKRNFYLK